MAEEAAAAAAATAALEKAMQSFSFREFDKAKESWEDYVFGFEQMGRAKGLFRQNNDEYSAARRTLLLAMMGSEALKVVRNHFRPNDVNEQPYENVKAALRSYYAPKVTVFSARIDFMKRNRLDGESFGQYANALRELVDAAEYGAGVIDFQLRDRFAAGIRHEKVEIEIRRKWPDGREGGNEVTFEQVFRLAEAVERAEKECAKSRVDEASAVKKVQRQWKADLEQKWTDEQESGSKGICPRCGDPRHRAEDECRAIDQKCWKCGEVGHFARVCQGSKHREKRRPKRRVKRVYDESKEGSDSRSEKSNSSRSNGSWTGSEYWTIQKLGSAPKRAVVRAKINGRKVLMDFDTGALQTTVGVETWKKLGSPVLKRTKQLHVYGGLTIELLGETTVDVEAFGQLRVQKMVVANVDDVPLFGSDWAVSFGVLGRMKKLGIDFKRLDPAKRRDIAHLQPMCAPLHRLLQKGKKGDWTDEDEAFFQKAKEKATADALSRLPLPSETRSRAESVIASVIRHIGKRNMDGLPVDSSELKRKTRKDPTLAKVLNYIAAGWPAKKNIPNELWPYYERREELSVHHGVIMRQGRVVVPQASQRRIMEMLHSGHLGSAAMRSLARHYVWWPKLDSQLERAVASCKECHQTRSLPAEVPLYSWNIPNGPWERVHIDFAGPIDGRMLFILVDAYSKWTEVKCMKKATTAKVVSGLMEWFSRFGAPAQIVSDNGPPFISSEFAQFCKQWGSTHIKTTPCHLKTNGLAEEFVQTLKHRLAASETGSFDQRMQSVLMAYRMTPQSTTGTTPAEMFLSRRLPNQLDRSKPDPRRRIQTAASKSKVDHDHRVKDRPFTPGTPVWVQNERTAGCTEGTVQRRQATHSYEVVVNGEAKRKHADQLRERISEKHTESTAEVVGEDSQEADSQETPGPTRPPETPVAKPVLRRSMREWKPVERYGYDTPVVKKISKRKRKKIKERAAIDLGEKI